MYNNIGEKIKGLAEGLFVVEAIVTFVGGIVLLSIGDGSILTGLLMLICGPLIAWISSWLLYAFGQFVDDIHAIRIRVNMPEIKAKNTQRDISKGEPTTRAMSYTAVGIAPEYEGNGYICPSCNMAMDYIAPCERCGYIPPEIN